MDIKKEREAFETYYIANHHDGDIHPNQQLLEWSEKGEFYFATSVNDLWDMWFAAKQQAIPDGFVVVPVEPTERMLDCAYSSISDNLHYADLENIYRAMTQEFIND